MRHPGLSQLALCAALLLGSSSARAVDNWPEFRGPDGDGHARGSKPPTAWSETNNVKWKTAIHGRGWSSPVVWGNQVWITTGARDGSKLSALCIDATNGRLLHDLSLFDVEKPQFIHDFNSPASPTPAIEQGRVYVTFGSPGTACLDTKSGKVLWQRRDIECNHYRGAGSSPILYKGLLIMNFDGSDRQFVIALDKETGKTVWQQNRSIDFKDLDAEGKPQAEGDFRKAFATPHVADLGGKPMLISQGAKATYAYDPLSGTEFWRVEERQNHSAGTRPVVGHGLVFVPTGWSQGQLLAIDPTGSGDTTRSHLRWKVTRSVAKKPSLLLNDDLVYMIHDGGVASAIDARSGSEVWTERIGGNFSASPILADGKIYFLNEEGIATVVEAGRKFKKVSESRLDSGFMSSPAVTGDSLLLRTKTHLYRIEAQ